MVGVVIEDWCPKCRKLTATDTGVTHVSELPATTTLWCPSCEDSEWEVTYKLVVEPVR